MHGTTSLKFIEMDLQEVGWWDMDSIDWAEDGSEPLGSIKCREFWVLLMTCYLLKYDDYRKILGLLLMLSSYIL